MIEEKKEKVTFNADIHNPFMGRILVKVIRDTFESYKKKQMEGLASEDFLSKLTIVDAEVDPQTGKTIVKSARESDARTPYLKGKIVKLAEDSFGERFQRYYGSDRKSLPKVGDIVLFVPNQNYKLDPEGDYSLISDEHVVDFIKGENHE